MPAGGLGAGCACPQVAWPGLLGRVWVSLVPTNPACVQHVPRYLMSSLLDETIEAVASGLSTAVYQRPTTPRAPAKRRRKASKPGAGRDLVCLHAKSPGSRRPPGALRQAEGVLAPLSDGAVSDWTGGPFPAGTVVPLLWDRPGWCGLRGARCWAGGPFRWQREASVW